MAASRAQQAATAKRRAQCIALKLAGMDFDAIAKQLEYSDDGAARKDFWRAFKANKLEEKQAVETLREVEGARLDRLQAAVWPKAIKGDLKAVETVRRLIAERIRLFGVAEPIRTEITGPGGGPVALATGSLEDAEKLFNIVRPIIEDDEDDDAGDQLEDQDERGDGD